MFPLSDTVLNNVYIYAVLAIVPLIFLLSERWRWLATIPFICFVTWATYFYPWQSDGVSKGYAFLAILMGAAILVALFLGTCLLIFIRRRLYADIKMPKVRSRTFLTMWLITLMPALISVAVDMENQRVPDAQCRNYGVEFIVSGSRFVFPPELGVRFMAKEPSIAGVRRYTYSNETKYKEDLKAICAATQNGLQPLNVSYGVSISSKRFVPNKSLICDFVLQNNSVPIQICQPEMIDLLNKIHHFRLAKVHKHPNGTYFPKPGYQEKCESTQNGSIQCKLADDFSKILILEISTKRLDNANEKELLADLKESFDAFDELFKHMQIMN